MRYLTFILGAGASVPYGLPTGDELVRHVATHMIRSDRQEDKSLGRKLELYDPLSIDTYLMKYYSQKEREDDLQGYKMYIAYEVVRSLQNAWLGKSNAMGEEPNEKPFKRFSLRNPENWLRFIMPELIDLYDKAPDSECPIKFISFNYDLSIESYIDNIIGAHTATKEFKEGFFKWFSGAIIHLYGQVGFYPWHKDCDQESMKIWVDTLSRLWKSDKGLSAEELHSHTYNLSRHIKVIGEPSRANGADVKLAKQWIEKSQTLVFSGYAFHPDNNKLLELEESSKLARQIVVGLYKTNRRTREFVEKLFTSGINSVTAKAMQRTNRYNGSEPENPLLYIHEDHKTYGLLKDELNLSQLYTV